MKAAEILFEYLYLRDPRLERSDLIVGFGHFDMKIPQHCARLYQAGYAPKVLFTGGRGAGSADLDLPEAIAFRKEFCAIAAIGEENLIIEAESTNTGQNIAWSQEVLQSRDPSFHFEQGISGVISVASPYRQRRVWLTLKKHLPRLQVFNAPPPTDFEAELALFAAKREDFAGALVGELERLKLYPEKGFICAAAIPEEVENAYQVLKNMATST